jgi:uncharacterized protein YjiS (DUF1127 family)
MSTMGLALTSNSIEGSSLPAALTHPVLRGVTCRWAIVAGLVEAIRRWQRPVGNRRDLARLDDAALRDLGLDRSTVEIESTMSYWRLR